jgi:hypothetical protein
VKRKNIYSNEVKIEKPLVTSKTSPLLPKGEKINNVLTIDAFQKDSEYIIFPKFVDKYNFITKTNILLK